MRDAEINRKLSEFAGFRYGCEDILRKTKYWTNMWFTPEGSIYGAEPPNFLDEIQGLGLLFRWVVPKLDRLYDISFVCRETPEWFCSMSLWSRSGYIEATAPSPTRALCMAVWKAIGGNDG